MKPKPSKFYCWIELKQYFASSPKYKGMDVEYLNEYIHRNPDLCNGMLVHIDLEEEAWEAAQTTPYHNASPKLVTWLELLKDDFGSNMYIHYWW